MTNTIEDVLITLGLSTEEADIYRSLLEHGPQAASGIATTTKVKRTYVYKLTEKLMTQGLVRTEVKGKTTLFAAESPDHLLAMAEKKKQQALEAADSLENILPSLKSMFSVTDLRPVVSYYEGLEGVKKVYLDTVKNQNSELLALLEPSKIDVTLEKWLQETYLPLRKQANIFAKVLVASTERANWYAGQDIDQLRVTKIIPTIDHPLKHEINIYGDKVAFINNLESDKHLAIVIDHPIIAVTFRSWFHLTWDKY